MTNSKKIAVPVEVLARLDTHKREPVMFLRSTLNSKGNITVWRNGQEEASHVDFYGTTTPLSGKDEKIMVQRFADAYGIKPEEVHLNRRLPRTPRDRDSVLKNLPAPQQQPEALPSFAGIDPEQLKALVSALPQLGTLIAAMTPQGSATAADQPAAPATNGTAPALTLVHDASTPNKDAAVQAPAEQPQQVAQPSTEQAAGAQQAEQQTEQPANNGQRRRMTRKEKARLRSEAAKKGAATRAAKRAASIEKQPAPQSPQGDLPQAGEQPAPMPQGAGVDKEAAPVVAATPDQVAAQVARIREQMNAQLDAVLQSLTPATQK